ncbi:M57 family metalloprotease [Sphingobacterium oryzagri]|uniref:M57 family metalloprotease n=1 Tax=Sphingobacterium oryzagri TaxID=3025669 RepID=A0ABY7WBZ7_9SPHI|nr:M57 family metalloprotease [Sphingobacterium sp. KACC 22765]WDF66992.1 M57 family metalloprotease [Sphingobacterium sp. KACC 22765]
MKKIIIYVLGIILVSCQKNEIVEGANELEHIEKLKALGFDLSQGFYETKGGYIVENDIFFSSSDIEYHYAESKNPKEASDGRFVLKNSNSLSGSSRVRDLYSQYRTTNIVGVLYTNNTVRDIKIYIDPALGNKLRVAVDSAINRFNSLGLSLIFSRTLYTWDDNIEIIRSPEPNPPYLMAAGTPMNGSPYPTIFVNTNYYNDNTTRQDIISTLAHEIGHCIGLRHTDYMDRTFSCNIELGVAPNEGAGSNGAIHIPGTVTSPERHSFMLACSNGLDRPFTANDIIALQTIYPIEDRFYVSMRRTVVEDRSYYNQCCDYMDTDYNYTAYFFRDREMQIPYYAEYPFVLRGGRSYNRNFQANINIDISVGQQSYNFGTFREYEEYEWGTLVNQDVTEVTIYQDYTNYLVR